MCLCVSSYRWRAAPPLCKTFSTIGAIELCFVSKLDQKCFPRGHLFIDKNIFINIYKKVVRLPKNVERFTILRVILAQGPC